MKGHWLLGPFTGLGHFVAKLVIALKYKEYSRPKRDGVRILKDHWDKKQSRKQGRQPSFCKMEKEGPV